ncbi:hypothetical protein ACMAZF_20405 (plasmid) [Psychrobium sp. nBUS_13]|uniref:hypothetical protein n=1 Tax=Psychrobium sp. nBUS_13 TaxID=3395319 RepID=UPI003EBDC75E
MKICNVGVWLILATFSHESFAQEKNIEMAGFDDPSLRLADKQAYFCTDSAQSEESKKSISKGIYYIRLKQGVKKKEVLEDIKFLRIGAQFCGYLERK